MKPQNLTPWKFLRELLLTWIFPIYNIFHILVTLLYCYALYTHSAATQLEVRWLDVWRALPTYAQSWQKKLANCNSSLAPNHHGKYYYHSLVKEHSWVEHLTSLPKFALNELPCIWLQSRQPWKLKSWWHATLWTATCHWVWRTKQAWLH